MEKLLEKYRDILIQKRHSKNTEKVYINYFTDFCRKFGPGNIDDLSKEKINVYISELIRERNISASQQNQRINAIKFYYEKVLGREKEYYELHRPHKEQKLPKVLSKNEVKKILSVCENIKHKSILMLIYSAGLRRSELINLKITDIDSERMVINIRGGKGKKDRISLLSDHMLVLLRNYYRAYRPKDYLFEGQNGGKYSPTSIANILKKVSLKAGIRKKSYSPYITAQFCHTSS